MDPLVAFEDLAMLDPLDLKAVLDQVSASTRALALAGAGRGLREALIAGLPPRLGAELKAEVEGAGPVGPDEAKAAQALVVEALMDLGRRGLIAFDDPEDLSS